MDFFWQRGIFDFFFVCVNMQFASWMSKMDTLVLLGGFYYAPSILRES